jgi:maleate cis-trans isomerase
MQSALKSSVYKVGFISPPAWFDISPTEFLLIAPKNTIVMQTAVRPPDFSYKVENFKNAIPELSACFDSLAAAGADVVAQFGYPFSLVHGWEGVQQVLKSIQGGSKADLVMMGVEVVHALRHLGCKSIAVASTYYSSAMSKMLLEYMKEARMDVLRSENWQSQGMAEDTDSSPFIGKGELDPMAWETPVDAVKKAVRDVSKNTPDADGILVTGGGMRLLHIVDELEQDVKKPIVGGDIALYWGILRRLGIEKGVKEHGKLLASLA